MKRKLLLAVLAILMTVFCAIGLTACGLFGKDDTHQKEETHQHQMQHFDAVAATCTEDGNAEYWYCSDCGKYFSDAEGKKEIADLSSTVIPAGHTFSEDWSYDETYHWHAATCEHSDQVRDKAEHTFENDVCSVCNAPKANIGLNYSLNSDEASYSVTGIGNCTDTEIAIPSAYNGLPVTSIGDSAFYNCDSLTSITIPDSVNSIGVSAFYNCSSLTSITIPDSVTSIGNHAFFICRSLNSVSIGNGVISIGQSAFSFCSSLTSLTIGNSVTSIGDSAFRNCISLANITIPDDITSIGDYVFYNCSSLTSITIPDSVTGIGDYAFWNCDSLTSITIPDSVTGIGDYAFEDCNSLKKVYITDIAAWCGITFSITSSNPLYYAGALYLNGELVTELDIPDGVTNIGNYAFMGCSSLTSITIPDSVTSIGNYAFSICDSLTSITIPDSVISIGDSAFRMCKSLTNIAISDGVKSIGSYAFENCNSLTSIALSDGITSIGNYAFNGCCSLTSITIPDSITNIEDYAFEGCYKLMEVYNLSSLNITKGETSNGYVAYYALNVYTTKDAQSKLQTTDDGYIFYEDGETVYLMGYIGTQTELTLPDTFNNKNYQIYDYAFSYCNSLTSINIPDSVTSIGVSAFYYCRSLTNVTIGNGITSIGNYAFYDCNSLTNITIPDCVTSIGNYAFSHCNSLTSVTIPDCVTSIGDSAFYGCYKLVEVYNLSSLNITKGETSNGYVAYYALNVYTTKDAQSKLQTTDDGYIFYEDGETVYLMGYIGTQTELTLPDTFNNKNYQIYDYAFSYCYSLTSINIPDSVTSIGVSAFYYCRSLTNVTIGNGVTSIEGPAFSYCSSLTSVTIGNGVTSIESYAFYYCYSLTSVTFENTSGWWVSDSSTATSGTSISSEDLADPSTAATYLKSTYDQHYWKRG